MVKKLSVNIWYMKYHFTIFPAVFVLCISVALSACISAGTDQMWNKGSRVKRKSNTERTGISAGFSVMTFLTLQGFVIAVQVIFSPKGFVIFVQHNDFPVF